MSVLAFEFESLWISFLWPFVAPSKHCSRPIRKLRKVFGNRHSRYVRSCLNQTVLNLWHQISGNWQFAHMLVLAVAYLSTHDGSRACPFNRLPITHVRWNHTFEFSKKHYLVSLMLSFITLVSKRKKSKASCLQHPIRCPTWLVNTQDWVNVGAATFAAKFIEGKSYTLWYYWHIATLSNSFSHTPSLLGSQLLEASGHPRRTCLLPDVTNMTAQRAYLGCSEL